MMVNFPDEWTYFPDLRSVHFEQGETGTNPTGAWVKSGLFADRETALDSETLEALYLERAGVLLHPTYLDAG
jgi:hypothetical protein